MCDRVTYVLLVSTLITRSGRWSNNLCTCKIRMSRNDCSNCKIIGQRTVPFVTHVMALWAPDTPAVGCLCS